MNAGLAIAVGGLLALLGSVGDWAVCSMTPCYVPDGALGGLAFSEMSGVDFGYGIVTAIAAIPLLALGEYARRQGGTSRFGAFGVMLSLLVLGVVSAYLIRFYVLSDESFTVSGPPANGAVLVACGGLLSLAASVLMRRGTLNRDAPE
jgi:hypothetical protein